MRRLLLISYYFPPNGGPGAQRPAKFAKYLPDAGWETVVLAPAAVQSHWAPADESLSGEIGHVRVERLADGHETNRWRPRVDRHQIWAAEAADRSCDLLKESHFDAVLITMSPFSLAHIGLELRRRVDVPVFLDLRDPWALDGWPTYRSTWHWRIQHRFMRHALRAASGIIANTPEALRALRAAVPDVPGERWAMIPNGYDVSDFVAGPNHSRCSSTLTIVCNGSLPSQELYPSPGLVAIMKRRISFRPEPILPEGRTLYFLLRALRTLRERGHVGADCVRIRSVGILDSATKRCVAESGVADQVELCGYLPHDQSLNELLAADALFLPLHGYQDRARRSLIVPGKTYEYLVSGKPILACLPEGDARELVLRSGRAYLAYPTDEAEVCDALGRLLSDWNLSRVPTSAPDEWLRAYERRSQAQQLAGFLANSTTEENTLHAHSKQMEALTHA